MTKAGAIIEKPLDFRKLFRILIWLVPAGVIGNVVFSLMKTDGSVLRSMDQFSWGYLSLAVVLALFPWIPDALKVMTWTRFLNHPIGFKDSLTIVISSELGSAISPTAVGGGYVKLGMLVQKGMPVGTAASLMVLGSLEMGLFFAVAVPVSVILSKACQLPVFDQILNRFLIVIQSEILHIILISAALILIPCFCIKALRNRIGRFGLIQKMRVRIKKFFSDFILIYSLILIRGKRQLCFTLLLTAVQWISRYSVITVLMAFLNVPVNPVLFFLFQWAVFSLGVLIPTPGGAVGVEAAFYFVYAALIPENVMGLAVLVWRFFTYYFLLIMDSLVFGMLHLNFLGRKIRWFRIGFEFLTKI